MDVAKSISEGFARNVISASFNGTTVETSTLADDGWQSYNIIHGMIENGKAFLAFDFTVMAQFLRKCIWYQTNAWTSQLLMVSIMM
jgi:threonyl-tRNA synthetase